MLQRDPRQQCDSGGRPGAVSDVSYPDFVAEFLPDEIIVIIKVCVHLGKAKEAVFSTIRSDELAVFNPELKL